MIWGYHYFWKHPYIIYIHPLLFESKALMVSFMVSIMMFQAEVLNNEVFLKFLRLGVKGMAQRKPVPRTMGGLCGSYRLSCHKKI